MLVLKSEKYRFFLLILSYFPAKSDRNFCWKTFQQLHLQNGYKTVTIIPVFARQILTEEGNQMCNFDCGMIWQILCQLFNTGC